MGIKYGLGKGLREPVSPYREAYFFGAELNSVDADGWHAVPQVMEPATSFDLSRISEYNEICVALIGVSDARSGLYRFTFEFYKERTNELLFDYVFEYRAVAGGWCYSYAYIGWVPWEINENGAYRVDLRVSGAQWWSVSIPFTITGIPPEVPEPVPTVGFMTPIVSWLGSVRDFFYSAKDDIAGVPVIGDYLATPFLLIGNCFDWLAYYTSLASIWVSNTASIVATILSWSNIQSLIIGWLPGLLDAITTITNLVDEAKVFLADPTAWLQDKWGNVVWPWAREYVWPLNTWYMWYLNNKTELELLFGAPGKYLRDTFKDDVLPWAIDNIPFISTLYVIYTKYAGEFGVFLDNPILWLRGKFQDDIWPWAKENIPFFVAITVLIDTVTDEVLEFLRDPLKWLYDNTILRGLEEFFSDPLEWLWGRFTDWFLGPEV